jgi:hypothetical protein
VSESLYVATDSKGVEHASTGAIPWSLPDAEGIHVTELGHPLVLRRLDALLDVLDQSVYRAEALFDVDLDLVGTVSVPAARLVARAHWNTEVATRFALDCADHLLSKAEDLVLPDGSSLAKVIVDARQVLDGINPGAGDRLGYLSKLRALRRLRHERSEISALALELMVEDEARDLDALEDPA